MAKPIIGRWMLWAIETAQESKEIANYFSKLKTEGKKPKLFGKLSQFWKLIDNVQEMPNLIMESGVIPQEWEEINTHWQGIVNDVKNELDLDDEGAEELIVQWIKAGKELGKAIELTIKFAKKDKV